MIERVQQTFGLWLERLAADGAYGYAANLAWLVEDRGIEPHIPVFDKSARNDGTFARSDFTFDHENDFYTCPGGHQFRASNRNFTTFRSHVDKDGFIRYRARVKDCNGCEFRQHCTPNTPARKIMRCPCMKSLAIWRGMSWGGTVVGAYTAVHNDTHASTGLRKDRR